MAESLEKNLYNTPSTVHRKVFLPSVVIERAHGWPKSTVSDFLKRHREQLEHHYLLLDREDEIAMGWSTDYRDRLCHSRVIYLNRTAYQMLVLEQKSKNPLAQVVKKTSTILKGAIDAEKASSQTMIEVLGAFDPPAEPVARSTSEPVQGSAPPFDAQLLVRVVVESVVGVLQQVGALLRRAG